jgi:porin
MLVGLFLVAPAVAQTSSEEEQADPKDEQSATEEQPDEQAAPLHKSGYEDKPDFAGPGSVRGQLEEDDRVKSPAFRFPKIDSFLQPWFDWKTRVNEQHDLQLGMDYSTLYQALDDSTGGMDDAWSGVFRVFGKWTLTGRDTQNTGALFLKIEQRHEIGTDIAPSSLAGQAGYLGITGINFNDAGLLLGDINWQQRLAGGRAGFIIGRFDPNDYMDVLGYANPWTTFSNLATLLNVSIALPDWSWGVGAGRWIGERWYVLGSVNDANGNATNEKFFDGGAEFFKQAEVGWSPSRDDRYYKNVHVTVWHVDERDDAGVDSADGVAMAANWTWDRTWMVFGRAGTSDGGAPLYNESLTAGFGRLFRSNSDVLGLAINRGEPPVGSLDEQTTGEVFYRLTFSQNLALTPSVQWLSDPALNTEEDTVWVFGFRARLSL